MGSNLFDYKGSAEFWNEVPLRTVKRAFFRNGDTLRTLMKMVVNSVTYDFKETAEGGVVIMPPDYSAIEFVSPDGRLDYNSYKSLTLGETFDAIEAVLEVNPIKAWDNFAAWMGANTNELGDLMNGIASCELKTVDGGTSTIVNIPNFSGFTNMLSFMEMIEAAIEPALNQPLTTYTLDTHAFGCVLSMTSVPDENGKTTALAMGFLFRE